VDDTFGARVLQAFVSVQARVAAEAAAEIAKEWRGDRIQAFGSFIETTSSVIVWTLQWSSAAAATRFVEDVVQDSPLVGETDVVFTAPEATVLLVSGSATLREAFRTHLEQ
jgi:hypothetical protein